MKLKPAGKVTGGFRFQPGHKEELSNNQSSREGSAPASQSSARSQRIICPGEGMDTCSSQGLPRRQRIWPSTEPIKFQKNEFLTRLRVCRQAWDWWKLKFWEIAYAQTYWDKGPGLGNSQANGLSTSLQAKSLYLKSGPNPQKMAVKILKRRHWERE